MGYSLGDRKQSDTTEMHTHMWKTFQLGLFKKKQINKRQLANVQCVSIIKSNSDDGLEFWLI